MKMAKEQLAAKLNGRQYGNEITREEEQTAKENNLVVIFGASDDLCEMRGAIDDEFDCYDGGDIECEKFPGELRAIWMSTGSDWGYETDLSYAEFNIYEDDMLYCVGIVVDLDEVPNKWRVEEHIGFQILRCTKCNGTINTNTYAEYYQRHFRFCPFCGKEMRNGK